MLASEFPYCGNHTGGVSGSHRVGANNLQSSLTYFQLGDNCARDAKRKQEEDFAKKKKIPKLPQYNS